MAPLNPSIQPTNDPNYRGWSSAVSPPDTIRPQGVQTNSILPQGQQIGDRSAEYLGKSEEYKMAADSTDQKAYGDLFKNITEMGAFVGKAGVAVVKKDIEDKVYDIADRERQAYTNALEKLKAAGNVNNILDTNEGGDGPGSDTPQDITTLSDRLGSLQSARDGGKISSSYYESRLLAEAKKLRAQYPGFRDEIDQQFAKVTGSNPANAYIRALTSDINRNANSAASEQKKALSFATQNIQYPGVKELIPAIMQGRATLNDVVTVVAPYAQQDYALKRDNDAINNGKLNREERQFAVGQLFDKAGGIAVGRIADAQAIKMGINTAEDAARLDANIKAGVVPTQQLVAWGNDLKLQETQLRLSMQRDAQRSGAVQQLGQSEVNKRIDQAVQPLKDMQDLIYAKDVGSFYRSQQDIKALNDDSQKAILTNPKLGPTLQVTNALKNIAGEQNLQKFSLDIIAGDYPNNLTTYMTQWQRNWMTQYNMKTTGIPTTFNDVIDDLKQKGINNKRFNNAIFNEVNKITDRSLPEELRNNYALAAFSPANRGMISKLSDDTVDSKGNRVTGQASIFQKFTTPEMTKAMWELGQKNPQAWKNYTDWAQETISSELMNRDVNSLAVIHNPAIHVGWDSDNKRLVARADVGEAMRYKAGGGTVINPQLDPEFLNVQRTVEKMNGYLGNYKNIAEAAGIPVDAFLIRTIANINPEAVRNTNSIPFGILRDLGLAQMKGIGSK